MTSDFHKIGGTGTHTLDLYVTRSKQSINWKTMGVCYLAGRPTITAHKYIGWGQVETGAFGFACMAQVYELTVHFDLSLLKQMSPRMIINNAFLTWDEKEASSCIQNLLGYDFRCWADGNGNFEYKPNGCGYVIIPENQNWMNSGIVEWTVFGPKAKRITGNKWDVTDAISWVFNPPFGQISRDTGFSITSPMFLRSLDGQDSTHCVSEATNIKLLVNYTILPLGDGTPQIVN